MRSSLFALALFSAACSSSLDLTPPGGRPYRCVADDQDSACPSNMFCGFDNICHPTDTPAAYPCAEKKHCAGGWECGADGRCVDPANDLLQPHPSDPPAFVARPLNPTVAWSAPTAVATDDRRLYAGPTGVVELLPVALVADGGVHALLFNDQGIPLSAQRRAPVIATSAPGVTDAVGVDVLTDEVAVAAGGNVKTFRWNLQTAALSPTGQLDAGGITSVQFAGSAGSSRLYAWSADTVWMRGANGWVAATTPTRIHSVLEKFGNATFLLGDSFYVSFRTADNWSQLDGGVGQAEWVRLSIPGITGPRCDGGAVTHPLRPLRVHTTEFSGMPALLELGPADGGPTPIAFGAGTAFANNGCAPYSFVPEIICPFCPSPAQIGRQLHVGGEPRSEGPSYRIEALCETIAGPDLSVIEGYEVSAGSARDGGCTHVPLQVPPILSKPGAHAFSPGADKFSSAAVTSDNIFVTDIITRAQDRTSSWEESTPLLLGDQPEVAGVIDLGGGPQTFALTLPDEAANITRARLYSELPGMGLAFGRLPDMGDAVPAVFVENRPRWLVLDTGLVVELAPGTQSGRLIARPSGLSGKLTPPFSARVVKTATGADELIVTSFDSILSADLTGVVPDLQLASLEVKLSPQPRIPILSIIVLPSPPPGARAAGYALTNGGLFSFTAITSRQWSSERVEIPLREWRELWLDRGRARLVYADGQTLSLPGRIPLADGLEGPPFSDFARACGYTWALRDDGLYRQDVQRDSGKGFWTKVDVPLLSFAAPLAGSRFFTHDDVLDVFNSRGRAVRLSATPCAAD